MDYKRIFHFQIEIESMKVSKMLSTEAVVEMIHNTCRKVACLSLKECNRYVTYLSWSQLEKVSLSFHLSVVNVNPNTRHDGLFYVCQIGFMPLLIGTPDKKVFFLKSHSVHYSLNSHLHTTLMLSELYFLVVPLPTRQEDT